MNKRVLKYYILMFTTIICIYFVMAVNIKKNIQTTKNVESIKNTNNSESINIETETTINLETIKMIEEHIDDTVDTNKKNITIYDEIDMFDETSFSPDIIATNSELFVKYREFMNALKKNEGVKYYILNKDYVRELYKKSCFFGDSNVDVLRKRMFLPTSMAHAYPGQSLRELREKLIDREVDISGYKNIIIWTGYVIKYIRDSKHYIDEHEKLIREIRKQNPNCKIFVCSLLPASQQTVENDVRNGSPHNLNKGKEYDDALSTHFKESYINTKVFINEDFYSYDGFHMKSEFCDLMLTYTGFYINLINLQK